MIDNETYDKELERISTKIERVDTDNLYQAVHDLRSSLLDLITLMKGL